MWKFKINVREIALGAVGFATIFLTVVSCYGYDVNDNFSISGTLALNYQYQDIIRNATDTNNGGAALPFQLELSFTPGSKDIFYAKFGFAAGNGLNGDNSPFNLNLWAADLEDDVLNLNGRNRDYLLTAWYKHSFDLGQNSSAGVTGGIIDATDYLDQNVYANDEFTQFMNEALVNGPNVFAPSYDIGAAMELEFGNLALTGVFMQVGENDDGNSYSLYGGQIGYRLDSFLGEGNYRITMDLTSNDFVDSTGVSMESHTGMIFSFDQSVGDILGVWMRFGWEDDEALINYQSLYSTGLDISGDLWGRENDNIGIGYAHLSGGNAGIDKSQVVEVYLRNVLNEYVALTLDIQWVRDDMVLGSGSEGFVYGVRLASTF